MKAREREKYSAGYGEACVTALLVLGPPPKPYSPSGERKYFEELRDWWMSTQNPGTSVHRSFRFQAYFNAWYRDQKKRGKNSGTI